MGWSLNIYGIDKETDKNIFIVDINRNSELYSQFQDRISLKFPSDDGTDLNLVELDTDLMNIIIADINNQIYNSTARLNEYEKRAGLDIVEDIISMKDYIDELKFAEAQAYMILYMVQAIEFGYSGFKSIKCNIS
jgi:hypothetical protein